MPFIMTHSCRAPRRMGPHSLYILDAQTTTVGWPLRAGGLLSQCFVGHVAETGSNHNSSSSRAPVSSSLRQACLPVTE